MSLFTCLKVEAIQIISHKSVSQKALTNSQLRRIYAIRQVRWDDNTPITVFVLPSNHEVHKKFTQENLNILPYKLERIWNKLTFSGLGVAPTVVASEAELVAAVASTPGAIGYLEHLSEEYQVNVIQVNPN